MAASRILSLACWAGIAVSCYALYVEHAIHTAKASGLEYTAACDFGASASCSKVLSSKYAKILSFAGLVPQDSMLDLPNAALGLVFYFTVLLWRALNLPSIILLIAATASLAFSAFLGYVLAFILHDFCLVCVTCYVINTIVFGCAARLWMNDVRKAAKVNGKID